MITMSLSVKRGKDACRANIEPGKLMITSLSFTAPQENLWVIFDK